LSKLTGRKALITGATGNLGKIFADTLAELGADLILVDLQGTDLGSLTTDLINRWGVSVESYHCDLEIQQERADLVNKIKRSNKSLNILVNNAAFVGTSDLPGWAVSFEEQSIDTWRRALEVNLTAIFDLCQGLHPLLKNSIGASIVNIASIYGMYGPDLSLYEGTGMNNPAAYSVSKGGLIQLTRWLSTSIAPEIRVNAIAPGGIYRNQPIEFVQRYESNTPLGRMAEGDDLKGALAFLCSDLSKYVSGQVLAVDGAWGVW
jgi:NAD(P)-dependent dehydrogenase (short-subunit alcohol dehydrogenase family)